MKYLLVLLAILTTISSANLGLAAPLPEGPWESTTITGLSWREFQLLDAEEKQNRIWQQIIDTAYPPSQLPARSERLVDLMYVMHNKYSIQAFLWPSDEHSADREGVKIVHKYGTVAKAQLIIEHNHPFSGLLDYQEFLEKGSIPLLVRFSESLYGKRAFSIAVKFLLDQQTSENILTAYALQSQETADFFEHEMCTTFPMPPCSVSWFGVKCFRLAQRRFLTSEQLPETSTTIPLSRLSRLNRVGNYARRKAQEKELGNLFFRPTEKARQFFSRNDFRAFGHVQGDRAQDYRDTLGEIPNGTILYEAWGCARSQNCANSYDPHAHFIGKLVLASQPISSAYGDQKLNFQHPVELEAEPEN